MNISAKRLLLAAATASSLAAVLVPQAASAAEVQCRGRGDCETRDLYSGRDQRVYYHATARERDGDRARGHCEIENTRTGYRVMDRRFYGSMYGQANVQRYNRYKMDVESHRNAMVYGRMWTR